MHRALLFLRRKTQIEIRRRAIAVAPPITPPAIAPVWEWPLGLGRVLGEGEGLDDVVLEDVDDVALEAVLEVEVEAAAAIR